MPDTTEVCVKCGHFAHPGICLVGGEHGFHDACGCEGSEAKQGSCNTRTVRTTTTPPGKTVHFILGEAESPVAPLDEKQKAMAALLNAIKVWVESGIGPAMMGVSLPALNVKVTFRGKRIIVEAMK